MQVSYVHDVNAVLAVMELHTPREVVRKVVRRVVRKVVRRAVRKVVRRLV